MHFLIDEDLPRSTGALLRNHGHEATDVQDAGLRGSDDATVAEYARHHRMCILTRDFGFGNIRIYPPGEYNGIVVLRVPPMRLPNDIHSFSVFAMPLTV